VVVVLGPVEIASHRLVVDVEDKGRGDGGPSFRERAVNSEVPAEIEDAESVGLCEVQESAEGRVGVYRLE
jgi:hypothetical protein